MLSTGNERLDCLMVDSLARLTRQRPWPLRAPVIARVLGTNAHSDLHLTLLIDALTEAARGESGLPRQPDRR